MCAKYLSQGLICSDRNKGIFDAAKALKNLDFHAIAVCGVSGMTFGSALAHVEGLDLIVVRKDNDINNHSEEFVEWGGDGNKILIVDDCENSGETVKYIRRRLKQYAQKHGFNYSIVGTYLYDDGGLKKERQLP